MTDQQLYDELLPVRMLAPETIIAPGISIAVVRDETNRPYVALTVKDAEGGDMVYEVSKDRTLFVCPYQVERLERLGFDQRITQWGVPK